MAVQSPPITYKPEWCSVSEKYTDICPFETRKSGNIYKCNCRNQDDTFKTVSTFNTHIRNKYHINWVKQYGTHTTLEIKKLEDELKIALKEKALLHAELEKQSARAEKYKQKYDKLKCKSEEYHDVCD